MQLLRKEAKYLIEMELNNAAKGVKELKLLTGELPCTPQQLQDHVVDAGITIDSCWSSKGWPATDAVVARHFYRVREVFCIVYVTFR